MLSSHILMIWGIALSGQMNNVGKKIIIWLGITVVWPLYFYFRLAHYGSQVLGSVVAIWLIFCCFLLGIYGLNWKHGAIFSGSVLFSSMFSLVVYVYAKGLYYWNFRDPRWGELPVNLSDDIVYWLLPLSLLTILIGTLTCQIGKLFHNSIFGKKISWRSIEGKRESGLKSQVTESQIYPLHDESEQG